MKAWVWGCSENPCKRGTIGNTFLYKGILAKQGTYVMAILRTGSLNIYRFLLLCSALTTLTFRERAQ